MSNELLARIYTCNHFNSQHKCVQLFKAYCIVKLSIIVMFANCAKLLLV